MLANLKLALMALKYVPSVFKYIPTILKHAPEAIAIFKGAKDLATKVEAETGINVTDALKDILGQAADKIQKPSEWSADDRKQWEDRGLSSGH